MKNCAIEQSQFAEFIDGLLTKAIRKGLTSFDEILCSLPGVYPSEALASLHRLAAQGKIPKKIHLDAIKFTSSKQYKQTTSPSPKYKTTGRILLPVPHPLDFDWRFGYKAIDYLLKRCLELTEPKDCVVLLGTPSVMARAVEINFPRKMILCEGNQAVTDSLMPLATNGSVHCCDLTADELPQISAKTVICDAPWYMEYIKSFLWSACQFCAIGGHLLLSVPPVGTRPNASQQWKFILEWATGLGLRLLKIEHGILPYVSPPFERNSLKAEGLHNIPGEWRRSNLALFIRENRADIPRPPKCPIDKNWCEETFQDVRIRFRVRDNAEFENPTLRSIISGDILTSVSRWDERRKLVDVWTSGHRVFKCDNPTLLFQIAKSIGQNHSVKERVTDFLGRRLTREEADLVAKASKQIINIINSEKNEYVTYWKEIS